MYIRRRHILWLWYFFFLKAKWENSGFRCGRNTSSTVNPSSSLPQALSACRPWKTWLDTIGPFICKSNPPRGSCYLIHWTFCLMETLTTSKVLRHFQIFHQVPKSRGKPMRWFPRRSQLDFFSTIFTMKYTFRNHRCIQWIGLPIILGGRFALFRGPAETRCTWSQGFIF